VWVLHAGFPDETVERLNEPSLEGRLGRESYSYIHRRWLGLF
jgi:hypothetical protein